ncbi:MAG: hypothetical protein HKL81_00525 [Acidimicrobiaceae bacterium]|nr:hypothetical protein [Acidimicrobiaceae bacterium]
MEPVSQGRGAKKSAHFGGSCGFGGRVFSYQEGSSSFLASSDAVVRKELQHLSLPLFGGLRSGLSGEMALAEDDQPNAEDASRVEISLRGFDSSCIASRILELAGCADSYRSHGMLRGSICNYEMDDGRHFDVFELLTNSAGELQAQDAVTLVSRLTVCRSRAEQI